MQSLGSMTHGRLLDIGCGSRPYEQYFNGVTEYIGFDI